jgi:hypothetical protein
MVTFDFVDGLIAAQSQRMEQVRHLSRNAAFQLQPPQNIDLGILYRNFDSEVSSGKLSQKFGKLTKFDLSGIRIFCEIAFAQSPKLEKQRLPVL